MDLSNLLLSIDSERLNLRALRESDVTDSYVAWMNDREVNRFLESRFHDQTKEAVQAFVRDALLSPNTLLFGIFAGPSGDHVGNIKVSEVSEAHLTAELGFIIGDRSVWGLGYATEAIFCVSEWAFSVLGLEKLTAGCYSENIGSKKALEKSGFRQEAVLKNQVVNNSGKRIDSLRFAAHSQQVA